MQEFDISRRVVHGCPPSPKAKSVFRRRVIAGTCISKFAILHRHSRRSNESKLTLKPVDQHVGPFSFGSVLNIKAASRLSGPTSNYSDNMHLIEGDCQARDEYASRGLRSVNYR